MRLEHVNSNLFPKTTQGSFAFGAGGGFTAFQNFLRGNAGGACGEPCSYSETDIDVINRFRSGRYEVYVQDTWRIHPTVTLDLGLRYAIYPPLTDDSDMLFTFSPDAYDPPRHRPFADPDGDYVVAGSGNPFNGIACGWEELALWARHLRDRRRTTCSPASAPRGIQVELGRTVVRAGYGMYFDQTQVGMFARERARLRRSYDPFRTDVFIKRVTLKSPRRHTRKRVLSASGAHGVITNLRTLVDTHTCDVYATSDPFVAPRWQHWNVGVQRRLYSRGMIDVGYVGVARRSSASIRRYQPAAAGGSGAAPPTWCGRFRVTRTSSCERRPQRAGITGS